MGDDAAPSLEELAAKAAAGDRDAFDVLVRRIHPRLVRLALAKTGSRDEADELVQRTLVRVYRGLPKFRGGSRLMTWIYRIVTNCWWDMERARRSRGKVEEPMMDEANEAAAHPGESADARLERREAAEILRRFLSELAPRQREVLELVDFQGFEPKEAAEALGLSPSTARVHLHRARQTIRMAIIEGHPELAQEYRR